jgi:hypothetical protein
MYTPIKELPTVPFPSKVEEFKYNSYEYLLGEKVHLFEDIKSVNYAGPDILTMHGFIINDKNLVICQRERFINFCHEDGLRYLGVGVVHKRWQKDEG